MRAEIISVGDELLIGQVINTNAAFLGDALSSIGVVVSRVTAVGDERAALHEAFHRAWSEHDVVIVTGGLGPTHDDITRTAVTEFFETPLTFNDQVWEDIQRFMHRLGRTCTDVHRDQAMVPAAAMPLRNAHGTAPGMHIARDGRHFFVLPGVPYEMRPMTEHGILPALTALVDQAYHRVTILTTGIPESALAARLEGVDAFLDDTTRLAYLPSPTGVRVRISARDTDADQARQRVTALQAFVEERVADAVFGHDTETIEDVVGRMLLASSRTVGIAESCTGGMIANMLTDIPGISLSLMCGAVTYSDRSKTDLLGVDPGLLRRYGAVSAEVAIAMAEGARRIADASYGIATTGIAGPSGGSAEKPVGLVWIALADEHASTAHRFLFGDNRQRTKLRASVMALDMLRRRMLGLPPPPSTPALPMT